MLLRRHKRFNNAVGLDPESHRTHRFHVGPTLKFIHVIFTRYDIMLHSIGIVS